MSDGRSCVHKLHVRIGDFDFRIFVNQLLLLFTYLFEKNKQLEIIFSRKSLFQKKKLKHQFCYDFIIGHFIGTMQGKFLVQFC